MATYVTKLTGQGQVSIPVELRKALGLEPGASVEWEQKGDEVVVRRRKLYSWDDIRDFLWSKGKPEPKTLEELNEGKANYVRARHASGRY